MIQAMGSMACAGRSAQRFVVPLLVALTIAACTASDTTTPRAASTTTPGPLPSGVLEDLTALTARWNRNQITWINALQDPQVSYAELLNVQVDVRKAQLGVIVEFRLVLASLPTDVAAPFEPIVDNYQQRLAALDDIFAAVTQQDDAGFDTALAGYQQISTVNVRRVLTDFFDHPRVVSWFADEGLDAREYRDAILSSVPGP